MKLSDIKGERVIDVIADIIEPVYNIAADEEAAKLLEGITGEHAEQALLKAAPKLLKAHKADVIAILAAIEGVSAEEYAGKMTMGGLLASLVEAVTDPELLAFLSSYSPTGKATAGAAMSPA